MKKGWVIKGLGDLCEILDSKRRPITKRDRISGNYPYYGATGVVDYVSGFIFNEPLVLVGEDGAKWASGEMTAYAIEGKSWVNNHAHVLRPRRNIVLDYWIVNYLNHLDLSKFISGLTVPKLNQGNLCKIPIPLPSSLAEQQRIVGILDEAFAGIAVAKANTEKNLQNARAIFESHLNAVFSQRGGGWVETMLGEVCGFVRGPFGGSLKKSNFVPDGYAVYEQQHAIYDQFHEVRYYINESKFREMKRFELLPNDLIMSCSGTMGRVAIVPNGIKRGIINQALLKLTPTVKISNGFLKLWMRSTAFQDALKVYSGGAAIQNVASVKVLKEIKIPLPSLAEQTWVVDNIESLSTETKRLETIYQCKLDALEELKKSLLHQAFEGNL